MINNGCNFTKFPKNISDRKKLGKTIDITLGDINAIVIYFLNKFFYNYFLLPVRFITQ